VSFPRKRESSSHRAVDLMTDPRFLRLLDRPVKPGDDKIRLETRQPWVCAAFMAGPLPVYEIPMAQQAAKARCYAKELTLADAPLVGM
jgi:hypothetical protein